MIRFLRLLLYWLGMAVVVASLELGFYVLVLYSVVRRAHQILP